MIKKIIISAVSIALLIISSLFSNKYLSDLIQEQNIIGITTSEDTTLPPDYFILSSLLGGFKGILIQGIWVMASDAKTKHAYYEIGDYYTILSKLQPQHQMAWIYQAWDLAYNIANDFKEQPNQQYFWIEKGLNHLRLTAQNRHTELPELDLEIATIIRHKLSDSNNLHLQNIFAKQMENIFGARINSLEQNYLLKTASTELITKLLSKVGLSVNKMLELNEKFGILDWRTPDAHALYWITKGSELAQKQQRFDWRYQRVLIMSLAGIIIRGTWQWVTSEEGRLQPNFKYYPITQEIVKDIINYYKYEKQPLALNNGIDYYLKNIYNIAIKYNQTKIAEECKKNISIWLRKK